MSAAVLNAIPAVGPVTAPVVPGRGGRPSFANALPAGAVVGSMLQVSSISDKQFYVVLADGVQSVEPVVARLLQFAVAGDPVPVSSSAMGLPPTARSKLAVDDLPQQMPSVLSTPDNPVSCMSWGRHRRRRAAGHPLGPTAAAGSEAGGARRSGAAGSGWREGGRPRPGRRRRTVPWPGTPIRRRTPSSPCYRSDRSSTSALPCWPTTAWPPMHGRRRFPSPADRDDGTSPAHRPER